MVKTKHINVDKLDRKWFVIDADCVVLGRLSSEVARILRGKHKAIWSPQIDTGDFVVVVNAEKVKLTGNKMDTKGYFIASSRPGSSHTVPLRTMLRKHPTELIRHAVWGMLPRGALGNHMITKLKLVVGPDASRYIAQKPEQIAASAFRSL